MEEGDSPQPHESSHLPATCATATHAATPCGGCGDDLKEPASASAASAATTPAQGSQQTTQPSPSAAAPPPPTATTTVAVTPTDGGMHAVHPAQAQTEKVEKAEAARKFKEGSGGACAMNSLLPIHATVGERLEGIPAAEAAEQALHTQPQRPHQPKRAQRELQAQQVMRAVPSGGQPMERRPQQTSLEPGAQSSSLGPLQLMCATENRGSGQPGVTVSQQTCHAAAGRAVLVWCPCIHS
eukprot:1161290-Pelagomonas_calceolata.AAC.4